MIYLFPVQLGWVCDLFFMELAGKIGKKMTVGGSGDWFVGRCFGFLVLGGFVFSIPFFFFSLIVAVFFCFNSALAWCGAGKWRIKLLSIHTENFSFSSSSCYY